MIIRLKKVLFPGYLAIGKIGITGNVLGKSVPWEKKNGIMPGI